MSTPHQDPSRPEGKVPREASSGCFTRFAWMGIGNGALVIVAGFIGDSKRLSFLGWDDLLYWAIVAATVAVRHVDITRFAGRTADGKPATLAHWRKYAVVYAAVALVIWIVAHLVAAR